MTTESEDRRYDVLETAGRLALEYLQHVDTAPVAASADYATLRGRLGGPLPADGEGAEQVIQDLVRAAHDGLMASAGGRFFGWVRGGSLPVAVAADWLTSAWDQNAALFSTAPVAAVVEEIVGDWLKQLLGLPSDSSFALVTGGQMANVVCLAAARHHVLHSRGWNLEHDGLAGAPPIRVLAGHARHASIDRALRLLGFGRSQVIELPIDDEHRVDPTACEAALAHEPSPALLILQAGDVNTGACDQCRVLVPMAKRHRAWVHVDGAFGLWAAASPRFAEAIRGAEQAHSWAVDGHKWLNVPYDCGYAFVADADAHRASMACHDAAYITHAAGGRDPMDWNPEWSRRARGFASYAALRHLGRNGVASLVERCCDHARELVAGIGQLPGCEVLWRPTLNQGLVRFRHPGAGTSERDHDERTNQVIDAIGASGEAFFSGTTWRGRRAMRVSVCSWRTTTTDVERTVRAIASVLAGMAEPG